MSKGLDDYKVISVSTTMAEIKRQQKEHKALEIIKTNRNLCKFIIFELEENHTTEETELLKEVLK